MVDPYCITNAGVDKGNQCPGCCDPTSVQIGTSAISGYSYNWAPSTALSCTNCAQPNASPCGTTSYTLTINAGPKCLSNTDIVVVTTTVPTSCCRLADFSLTGDQNIGTEFSVNPTFVENSFEVKYKEEAQNLIVLDVNGKTVYKIEELIGTNVSIDISDLSSGVYFVSVLTNGKLETKKIVKK